MAMQLTFDDLQPATLEALAADDGVPPNLREKIKGLLAKKQQGDDGLSLAHGGGGAFVAFCRETARQQQQQ
jgi:hypothetical protein